MRHVAAPLRPRQITLAVDSRPSAQQADSRERPCHGKLGGESLGRRVAALQLTIAIAGNERDRVDIRSRQTRDDELGRDDASGRAGRAPSTRRRTPARRRRRRVRPSPRQTRASGRCIRRTFGRARGRELRSARTREVSSGRVAPSTRRRRPRRSGRRRRIGAAGGRRGGASTDARASPVPQG